MGVTGLWRLIEPAGKPVPLESLENKILAVDISIWLHQMVKGYQDPRGGIVVNAHLIGLFQRLCKLLYYKIKPVFVFDGGIPVLKIQTMLSRQQKKNDMHSAVDKMRKQLLKIAIQQMAVSKVMAEKCLSPKRPVSSRPNFSSPENDDVLFKLPPIEDKESALVEPDFEDAKPAKRVYLDLHSIDINSDRFKNLTLKEKHDLLTDLKETRKQSSWGRIHELPSQTDCFSDYQMQRLLKRRQVQVSLEEIENEMGGHYLSLNELEILLNEEGIDTKIESIPTRQIASDENTHYVLIKDVKEAIDNAMKREISNKNIETFTSVVETKTNQDLGKEYHEDLETALKLSLECFDEYQPSTSKSTESFQDNLEAYALNSTSSDGEWQSDCDSNTDVSESENTLTNTNLALAKAYMLENCGLTKYEIKKIIKTNSKSKDNAKMELSLCNQKENIIKQNRSAIIIDEKNSSNSPFKVRPTAANPATLNVNDEICEKSENLETMMQSNVDAKIVNSNNHLEPDSKISIISDSFQIKPLIMSSDSESDDSFEEVQSEALEQDKVEINLNIGSPLEDDIFADIFEHRNLEVSSEIATNSYATHLRSEKSVINLTLDASCNEIKTLSQDTKKADDKLKSPIMIEPLVSEIDNDALLDRNKCTAAICNDGLVSIENNVGIVAFKESPQKEFTLKEVNLEVITNNKRFEVSPEIAANNKPTEVNLEITAEKKENDEINPGVNQNKQQSEVGPEQNKEPNEVSLELYKKFNKINPEIIANKLISTDDLMTIAGDLEKQKEDIQRDQRKLDRMGRNISKEMTEEVQNLLKMFGIPYIVAPKEAEAQCAFLESIGLTNGTITDDSDIWLFGGKNVYKNFFDQQKYVLQFLADNIYNCFKLSREQLILLALLVGSDYTAGISGVGPVTAMEILSTFPVVNCKSEPPYTSLLVGLKKFKSWCTNSRAYDHSRLRSKLKNITFSQEFPSLRVISAYLEPQVDENSEGFSWGKPDITALRDFTRQKFGWSQMKTDEILKPVLKRLDEKISQSSIRAFFQNEIRGIPGIDNVSKRVKRAVEKMGNTAEGEDDSLLESKPKKPRKNKTFSEIDNKQSDAQTEKNSQIVDDLLNFEVKNEKPRKRKISTSVHEKDKLIHVTSENDHDKKLEEFSTHLLSCMSSTSSRNPVKKSCKKNTETKNENLGEIISNNEINPAINLSSSSAVTSVGKPRKLKEIKPFIPERYQETIPQRESDKTLIMKNKLKAIELFRTSRQGPGYVKKSIKKIRQPKPEADLSEDSD